MTGPPPEEWDDGLEQPVEPFTTPRWFKWTIGVAVVLCFVLSAFVLL